DLLDLVEGDFDEAPVVCLVDNDQPAVCNGRPGGAAKISRKRKIADECFDEWFVGSERLFKQSARRIAVVHYDPPRQGPSAWRRRSILACRFVGMQKNV